MLNAGDRLTIFATKPSFLWLHTTLLSSFIFLTFDPDLKVAFLPSGRQNVGRGEPMYQ